MPRSSRSRADKKDDSREDVGDNQEAEAMTLETEDRAERRDRMRTSRSPPPAASNPWWRRSRSEIQQPPHQCFTFAFVPVMMVVTTVILIVLASKYKHLEDPAEMALNATLEILKSRIR